MITSFDILRYSQVSIESEHVWKTEMFDSTHANESSAFHRHHGGCEFYTNINTVSFFSERCMQ